MLLEERCLEFGKTGEFQLSFKILTQNSSTHVIVKALGIQIEVPLIHKIHCSGSPLFFVLYTATSTSRPISLVHSTYPALVKPVLSILRNAVLAQVAAILFVAVPAAFAASAPTVARPQPVAEAAIFVSVSVPAALAASAPIAVRPQPVTEAAIFVSASVPAAPAPPARPAQLAATASSSFPRETVLIFKFSGRND